MQMLAVASLGAAGAAWVGYETSLNPGAGPQDVAVVLRVAIIVVLILSGLFARLSRSQRSMGTLLILAGLFSSIWLLNGSRHELIFSLGLLASGLAPGLFAYLMLAFPSGKIKSRREKRFIVTGTCLMGAVWILGVLSHPRAIISTPLLHCPPRGLNAFFIAGLPDLTGALRLVVRADWLLIAAGTGAILIRRVARANPHFRRLLAPMVAVAVANALAILGFVVSGLERSPAAVGFGIAYVATALAIPVAIFLGLVMERLSLGRVLARFVSALGTVPANSVQNEMADTLNDPRLRIFYRNQGSEQFVDSNGVPLSRAAETDDRRQTVVQSAGRPLAVVDYDASLSDQEDFIKAAGKSAAIWLDTERLVGELASSRSSLEASRARLATTADEERRRIQRDLHDGAQQHLIGMHLKLELALEAIDEEPARSAALLAEIGEELGETASDLRSLASDVFPPALTQYGLVEALRAAVRRMDVAVCLQANGVSRHPPEVETPMYFACLEALQNVSKHGGVGANATLRLWEVKRRLFIELRDSGNGFEPEAVTTGSGLQNMRDRLESVGGRLTVTSARGCGTVVRAVVPIRRSPGARRNGKPVWQRPPSLKMPIA